ncbi:MAG TPA: hypothetical protein VLS88_16025 [Polyangiales bacterium]|nr:hypothetical protein [Polyangiales bacterium]
MPKLAFAGALAVLFQCVGCGQFFVASSVKASPDGSAHVFSTKDAYVCQVAETNEPVCTQVAKH